MARAIAVDLDSAFRAVILFKNSMGEVRYHYEGIYDKESTAKARISYWRNHSPYFYDAWSERADITWNKVKD